MADLEFGCCSSYIKCSDEKSCVKKEYKDLCRYWRFNLSKGNIFYGINAGEKAQEGHREAKTFIGHIYIILNNRAFIVSSRSSKNFSYTIDKEAADKLIETLDKLHIRHELSSEGFDNKVTGEANDRADYRVNFDIEEFKFNIKNFNHFELRRAEALEISAAMSELHPEIIALSTGRPISAPAEPKKEIRIPVEATAPKEKGKEKKEQVKEWKYEQLTLF